MEYAYVETNGEDPEPLLIKGGARYYCENVMLTSDGLNKACYVEKTFAQKTGEFKRSLLKTPEALARDLIVIGKVTVQAIAVLVNGGSGI